MKKPDIPIDEKERLKTLKSLSLLDTSSEERFDRLTRIAQYMFKVPISVVSLVDEDRQWFKSCIGMDTTETSRDISFCGHAINYEKVFIVRNAIEDARFADNPLVLNYPNIRFYAGCPLSINGHKIGMLCLIDTIARDFTEKDIKALEDLATMVEHELVAVQLAMRDELTKLLNRRGFLSQAQNNLSLSLRHQSPITLIYLDLNHFKSINDNFGHTVGDSVLITFANLIKNTFRDSDLIARIGGDEFVLLLNDTSEIQAKNTIEKFQISLSEHHQHINSQYNISFSYGIVEYDHKEHETIGALLSLGDKLMYRLKKLNR